jgi:hypothetical protein
MSGANEKWKELCEQVIAERDPKRLTELMAMLNDELEARESETRRHSRNKSLQQSEKANRTLGFGR